MKGSAVRVRASALDLEPLLEPSLWEVRGDDPELASYLLIEERKLEVDELN
jgi:hypothetical protein